MTRHEQLLPLLLLLLLLMLLLLLRAVGCIAAGAVEDKWYRRARESRRGDCYHLAE